MWVVRVALALSIAMVSALGGAASARAEQAASGPDLGAPVVVVVAMTGVRWDDVGALTTPGLWGLAQTGSVGTVSVRSVGTSACPADGWLALSAGARASDSLRTTQGRCRALTEPGSDGLVPAWADYVASAAQETYGAKPGLLGDTLTRAGVRATGIGPGAAIALADAAGRPVGDHLARPARAADLTSLLLRAIGTSRLVVVDVGSVRDPGGGQPSGAGPVADRTNQVRAIDDRVGAVLQGVTGSSREATVLVASIADSGTVPHLQLAVASGPSVVAGGARYSGTLLESRSTRQPGYLTSTDLTPTVLSALGISDRVATDAMVGSPVTAVPGPPSAGGRVAAMIDQDVRAWAVRPLVAPFFVLLTAINVLLYALVTLALNAAVRAYQSAVTPGARVGRVVRPMAAAMARRPRAVLAAAHVTGVAVASIPVATVLANLTPWWRAGVPSVALCALVVGWVGVITALAVLPRWTSWLLGPVGVVAAVTAAVFTADIATGARLQVSALMGVQPLFGARFYGFNSQAFAVFGVSTILLAVAIASPLLRRGRRRSAVAVILAIGTAAAVMNGLPGLGSKFGGPPALVSGFAVLALFAAGIRISWWKLLGVLGAGVAAVTGFAVLDWLRPVASQTHLGRFVQTVLDGGAWTVIARKGAANLDTLVGNWFTLPAIAGLALVALGLWRPLRASVGVPDGPLASFTGRAPLTQLGADVPLLRPGLIAVAVTLGLGFALSDSGIVLPAIGITIVVPLMVAAGAGWTLRVSAGEPAPRPKSPA
jgi:hypothetical protein